MPLRLSAIFLPSTAVPEVPTYLLNCMVGGEGAVQKCGKFRNEAQKPLSAKTPVPLGSPPLQC